MGLRVNPSPEIRGAAVGGGRGENGRPGAGGGVRSPQARGVWRRDARNARADFAAGLEGAGAYFGEGGGRGGAGGQEITPAHEEARLNLTRFVDWLRGKGEGVSDKEEGYETEETDSDQVGRGDGGAVDSARDLRPQSDLAARGRFLSVWGDERGLDSANGLGNYWRVAGFLGCPYVERSKKDLPKGLSLTIAWRCWIWTGTAIWTS